MYAMLNTLARISRVALSPRIGPGPIQGERELREIEAVICIPQCAAARNPHGVIVRRELDRLQGSGRR
jgi:hypothetical protein